MRVDTSYSELDFALHKHAGLTRISTVWDYSTNPDPIWDDEGSLFNTDIYMAVRLNNGDIYRVAGEALCTDWDNIIQSLRGDLNIYEISHERDGECQYESTSPDGDAKGVSVWGDVVDSVFRDIKGHFEAAFDHSHIGDKCATTRFISY